MTGIPLPGHNAPVDWGDSATNHTHRRMKPHPVSAALYDLRKKRVVPTQGNSRTRCAVDREVHASVILNKDPFKNVPSVTLVAVRAFPGGDHRTRNGVNNSRLGRQCLRTNWSFSCFHSSIWGSPFRFLATHSPAPSAREFSVGAVAARSLRSSNPSLKVSA